MLLPQMCDRVIKINCHSPPVHEMLLDFPNHGHLTLTSTCSGCVSFSSPPASMLIHQPLFPSQLSDCQCCFMPSLSCVLNLNLNPDPRLAAFACKQSLFLLSVLVCLVYVWILFLAASYTPFLTTWLLKQLMAPC